MADPVGTFNPTGVPAGWFSDDGQPEGWFDRDFLQSAAAAAAGIIALCFGYAEHAPAIEIEESFVAQVIEAPAAESSIPWYVTDPAEDDDLAESLTEPLPIALLAAVDEYVPAATLTDLNPEPQADAYASLLWLLEIPSVAESDIPPPALTDPEEPEPLEDALIAYQFEDDVAVIVTWLPDEDDFIADQVVDSIVLQVIEDAPAPDLTQIPPPSAVDLDEPAWIESYSAHLLHLEAPEVVEEAPAVLTVAMPDDDGEQVEALDSFVASIFDDDGLPLTVEMPDGEEDAPTEESWVYQIYDEAPPPDLTFVPGWQDDYLRAYEVEREDADEAALVGMVFDPFGQVDDPPPVVPGTTEFIIRARRRRGR